MRKDRDEARRELRTQENINKETGYLLDEYIRVYGKVEIS